MRKRKTRARHKRLAISTVGAITAIVLLNGKVEASGVQYTVKSKDTLYALSKKYQVSVKEIMEVNSLASDKLIIGQQLLLPNDNKEEHFNLYTIQKGDTLYSLAQKHGLSVREIKKINNLQTDQIHIGQKVRVPMVTKVSMENDLMHNKSYTVVAGDTLWGIAKRFGVTANEIMNVNGLSREMVLIGQELNIPGTIHLTEVEVVGAADNFTVEFKKDSAILVLQVPYGTASEYQQKTGQKVMLAHKNGSVISIH